MMQGKKLDGFQKVRMGDDCGWAAKVAKKRSRGVWVNHELTRLYCQVRAVLACVVEVGRLKSS